MHNNQIKHIIMKNLKSIFVCSIMTMAFASSVSAQSPFELPALNYAYNALEPAIDKATMQIHHSKHHQGYVNKLNKAIEGTEAENLALDEILKNISVYPTAVRNNAGGHFNHTLFWTILTPKKNT